MIKWADLSGWLKFWIFLGVLGFLAGAQ